MYVWGKVLGDYFKTQIFRLFSINYVYSLGESHSQAHVHIHYPFLIQNILPAQLCYHTVKSLIK
jgi:hypothetical protein